MEQECKAFNEANFPVPDVRHFKPYRRPISFASGIEHSVATALDVDALVRHDARNRRAAAPKLTI